MNIFRGLFEVADVHEPCYAKMEDMGIAVFGMCGGDDQSTERLEEHCLNCPYYVSPLRTKGDAE